MKDGSTLFQDRRRPVMIAAFTPRQIEIATAAGPVFLAQGFARTTMGDLARAARLSRQGLYLIFPRKEDVFAAAVAVLDETLHRDLAVDLAARRGLRAKLDRFFDRWIAGVFELQQTTPDSRDMDDLAFPVVRAVYDRKIALIRQLIEADAPGVLPPDHAHQLARATMFAIRGFFATATDGQDIRRLAGWQVELLVHYLDRQRG